MPKTHTEVTDAISVPVPIEPPQEVLQSPIKTNWSSVSLDRRVLCAKFSTRPELFRVTVSGTYKSGWRDKAIEETKVEHSTVVAAYHPLMALGEAIVESVINHHRTITDIKLEKNDHYLQW